ncbi:hypothetical protein JTE90_011911 [Oedothorax gibbosus]|uniref:Uncharacterized protein n=1 Tax=Oedothorax gibbosus TaxID=931172 RepID=A0AAV6V2B0_9ARAC|nr:hypothetical protein JTE90_011911 [Oedothorax gibbosus]
MKLAWMFCFLLAGKLSTASPAEQGAEANSGTQYMMAFPLDDDNIAEESAQEAVKMLAESLTSSDDEDKEEAPSVDQEDQKVEEPAVEEDKKEEEQPEPMGILQAELDAEEQAEQKPALPQRPFFKRPKIEELRKILGFPPQDAKVKPIPQEKPKMFQGIFNKPRPKMEITTQPSPLGGMQINLRREDRMRPFGFPMLPLNREAVRPFGFPDLVQAASSLLRRAMVDDENNENDITKDDKDEDDNINENNELEDNDDEEGEDDNLMIVPIPDSKEVNMERPPLFRRFPIPFPFPVPKQMPPQNNRPRMPFPPLAPVAFFLPIAQQIMQNIRQAQPRSQPPMMPMHPAPNFIPIQTQMPFVPIHHPMQQQQQHFIPIHQPMPQQQQFVPFVHVPQASYQVPVLLPNIQRQVMRQPRRIPMQVPQPQMQRRIPFPNPMNRMAAPQHPQPMPQQLVHHMVRQPLHAAARPMPQMVRPPMHPVHPVFFMVPHMPMAQQQVPVFQRPPQGFPHPMAMMPHQRSFPAEEQRVVFVRHPEQEEQDDDQEVLILVPSDEVEQFQRPPVMPPPQIMMRQMPAPASPIQRIRLLRDLLMARQGNRQPMPMSPRAASRVVEIVQQQLRIFPAHHQQQQHMMQVPHQLQRADPSELHPVYVPFPGAH